MLRAIPMPAVIRIPGGINRGMKWMRKSANAWEWLGIYESAKQSLVKQVIAPGMCVFDVGANAGFYSLAFSTLVGPQGRVVAIEPLARNIEKILTHVRLNRCTNISLIQTAASERTQIVPFKIGTDDFTGQIAKERQGSYLVPSFALDDIVSQRLAPDPDLLKIDVEGAEESVLLGARGILRRRAPAILLALHSNEQKAACHSLLNDFHYQFFDMNRQRLRSKALPGEVYAVMTRQPPPTSDGSNVA